MDAHTSAKLDQLDGYWNELLSGRFTQPQFDLAVRELGIKQEVVFPYVAGLIVEQAAMRRERLRPGRFFD